MSLSRLAVPVALYTLLTAALVAYGQPPPSPAWLEDALKWYKDPEGEKRLHPYVQPFPEGFPINLLAATSRLDTDKYTGYSYPGIKYEEDENGNVLDAWVYVTKLDADKKEIPGTTIKFKAKPRNNTKVAGLENAKEDVGKGRWE